jgi:membrane protein
MRRREKVKIAGGVFTCALNEFRRNDPLRMSASMAFFTIFALPAIPFILITIIGNLLRIESISSEVINEIGGVFGPQGSELLKSLLTNIDEMNSNWYYTLAGGFFLLFVATTLFIVIQTSLNQIWCVRLRKGKGWKTILRQRGMSLAFIFILGLLFIIALIFDTFLAYTGDNLGRVFPDPFNVALINILSRVASTFIIVIWFACTYKFLPDVHVKWKPVLAGSVVAGILFAIAKYLLSRFLAHSPLGTIYGASGTIVIMILFVYFTSFILFFGAAFVKAFSDVYGYPSHPRSYAERFKVENIDED